jgi:hypothetical protein
VFIDIAFGGIYYVMFSWLFNKGFSIWILGYAIFMSFLLPDSDGIVFALWEHACKFFGWEFKLRHHKIYHWPLVMITAVSILVYLFTQDVYLVCISLTGLLYHYIHDSLPPDPGPQWGVPINQKHYCIERTEKGYRIISRTRKEFFEIVREFWEKKGKNGATTSVEISEALKLTPMSVSLLAIAAIANISFWLATSL